MSRLIVEAKVLDLQSLPVSPKAGRPKTRITVLVSVSFADSGLPVTVCSAASFRVTNLVPSVDFYGFSLSVQQKNWVPPDNGPAGIYELSLDIEALSIPKNQAAPVATRDISYGFGIQVSVDPIGISREPTKTMGQTIVTFKLPA